VTPPPPFVVLIVRKTTPYEWAGSLSDGGRLYARFRDGAWCVRVATGDEDPVAGREIASGTYSRGFTYRNLKARTKGLILWPPADDVLDMTPETTDTLRKGLEDVAAGRVVGPFTSSDDLTDALDL
jgi:hypothetical protein